MYKKNTFFYAAIIVLLSSCLTLKDKEGHYQLKNTGDPLELTVLSFNILATLDFSAPSKGYPPWSQRKPHVFNFIKKTNANLVALQEISISQLDQIKASFSNDYKIIHNKSYTPDAILLFKRHDFELIERGHWLLEDIENIKRVRRIAIWVKLRHIETKRELMFISTHLDNNDWKDMQLRKIKTKLYFPMQTQAPLVLAGDFNIEPNNPNFYFMLEGGWNDAYHAIKKPQVGTYPYVNPNKRIDHILYYGKDITAVSWRADETKETLSDHRPVVADFFIKKSDSSQ